MRARGGRLLQRVRLQPARAVRLREHVLARRARSRPPTSTSRSRPARASAAGPSINWTNCLRTRPWVREQWASEHGLEGVDGPDYDRHLDAVFERLSVNDRCSDLNGPQQRMKEGAERARLVASRRSCATPTRSCYDPASAAYLGFGDQSGSKLSTAADLPAGRVRRAAPTSSCAARVERVLVENGRAAGVEGTWIDPETGRTARVTVRAPQVVVAAGSLESPALLLRSRDRRPGGRQLPAPASLHRAVRHLRRGPAGLVGPAAGRPRATSSPTSRTATAS